MKTGLLFKNLFARALKDWPQSLDLVLETQEFEEIVPTNEGYDLVCYKNLPWDKSFKSYTVKDLYDFCENVGHKYIGHNEEILMRNLHDAIYYVLHNISKYFTHIEFKNLRPEIVQEKFEEGLKKGLEAPHELNWSERSIKLVQGYFSVNYSANENK